MTLLFALLLAGAVAHADECLPIATWADRARDDLVSGELERARADLDAAEASLACRIATREELARYWLYSGALATIQGDDEAAAVAFSTARRLEEDGWDPTLGDAVHAAWAAAVPGAQIEVTVDANATRTRLDGERVRRWPVTTQSGRLTVQVLGYEKGEVYGARVLVAPPAMETVLLETGLPELPPEDRSKQRRRAVPWFVAGASSFALSGGAALFTLAERTASGTAPTYDAATAHREKQLVGAWTTVGLAGTGTILLGVGAIVW